MTTYVANAVDIPATMSSSNGDYVRTGGPQALYTAGDGQFVTYTYANGSDHTPEVSGGFQPIPTLTSSTFSTLNFYTTLSFVNPTNAVGQLQFTVIQPTDPYTLIVGSAFPYATIGPGMVTMSNGYSVPVSVSSLRLGTLRWSLGWVQYAGVAGQILTIDRLRLEVVASSSTLTAPALSAGQGRFDLRKGWAVTG